MRVGAVHGRPQTLACGSTHIAHCEAENGAGPRAARAACWIVVLFAEAVNISVNQRTSPSKKWGSSCFFTSMIASISWICCAQIYVHACRSMCNMHASMPRTRASARTNTLRARRKKGASVGVVPQRE